MKRFLRDLLLLIEAIGLAMSITDYAYSAEYEFPKGVPVRVREVEWYLPTDLFQDFSVGTGGLSIRDFHTNTQNWNKEFPWISGGVDDSSNCKTYKFHKKGIKVVQHTAKGIFFDNDRADYLAFTLAPGEYVGEVIQTDDKTTEVRLLIGDNKGQAQFKVFRPFRTFEDLEPFVVKKQLTVERLKNNHTVSIIDETRLVCDISLNKEGVKEVLSRTFTDVTDVVFAETTDGHKCFAPTTKQRNSVVPINYKGGFFSSKNCFSCHATAGVEGRILDHDPRPDKYGNIRGGGFIFSAPLVEWARKGMLPRSVKSVNRRTTTTGFTKVGAP